MNGTVAMSLSGSFNSRNCFSSTALHEASKKRKISKLRILIAAGKEIEARDGNGNTPLMVSDNAKVAEILLQHGASVKFTNNKEQNAFKCAVSAHRFGIAWLFVKRKIPILQSDVNLLKVHAIGVDNKLIRAAERLYMTQETGVKFNDGLIEEVHTGNINNVKITLDQGVSTEERDHNGNTLLAIAAREGYVKLVKELLLRNADKNSKNHEGQTPIDGAIEVLSFYNGAELNRKGLSDVIETLILIESDLGDKNTPRSSINSINPLIYKGFLSSTVAQALDQVHTRTKNEAFGSLTLKNPC